MRALGWLGIVGMTLGGCRGRCPDTYESLEIGIGARDFIDVPYGEQVSPDSEPGADPPFFNVALRGTGLPRNGNIVELEATVDGVPYATARHEGVALQCRGRRLETGGLQLFLDPHALPPQTRPIRDGRRNPGFDTGFDSGWHSGHTGRPLAWKVDLRVRAAVLDAEDDELVVGETWWFVYR